MSTLPAWLSVDELAAELRVGRTALYAAIKRDEVPGVVKIGRRIRISRSTIEAQWGALSNGGGSASDA